MDEQKTLKKVLTVTQQSITEFLRYLKKAVELCILQRNFEAASEMERKMFRVQESPYKYTVITVKEGREQYFADILNQENIDHIYINSDFLSDYNGSWIVNIEDFQRLLKNPELGIELEAEDLPEKEKDDNEDHEDLPEDSRDEHDTSDEENQEDSDDSENPDEEKSEKETEEEGSGEEDDVVEEEETPKKKEDKKKENKTVSTPSAQVPSYENTLTDPYMQGTEVYIQEVGAAATVASSVVMEQIPYSQEPVPTEAYPQEPVFDTQNIDNSPVHDTYQEPYPSDQPQNIPYEQPDPYAYTENQTIIHPTFDESLIPSAYEESSVYQAEIVTPSSEYIEQKQPEVTLDHPAQEYVLETPVRSDSRMEDHYQAPRQQSEYEQKVFQDSEIPMDNPHIQEPASYKPEETVQTFTTPIPENVQSTVSAPISEAVQPVVTPEERFHPDTKLAQEPYWSDYETKSRTNGATNVPESFSTNEYEAGNRQASPDHDPYHSEQRPASVQEHHYVQEDVSEKRNSFYDKYEESPKTEYRHEPISTNDFGYQVEKRELPPAQNFPENTGYRQETPAQNTEKCQTSSPFIEENGIQSQKQAPSVSNDFKYESTGYTKEENLSWHNEKRESTYINENKTTFEHEGNKNEPQSQGYRLEKTVPAESEIKAVNTEQISAPFNREPYQELKNPETVETHVDSGYSQLRGPEEWKAFKPESYPESQKAYHEPQPVFSERMVFSEKPVASERSHEVPDHGIPVEQPVFPGSSDTKVDYGQIPSSDRANQEPIPVKTGYQEVPVTQTHAEEKKPQTFKISETEYKNPEITSFEGKNPGTNSFIEPGIKPVSQNTTFSEPRPQVITEHKETSFTSNPESGRNEERFTEFFSKNGSNNREPQNIPDTRNYAPAQNTPDIRDDPSKQQTSSIGHEQSLQRDSYGVRERNNDVIIDKAEPISSAESKYPDQRPGVAEAVRKETYHVDQKQEIPAFENKQNEFKQPKEQPQEFDSVKLKQESGFQTAAQNKGNDSVHPLPGGNIETRVGDNIESRPGENPVIISNMGGNKNQQNTPPEFTGQGRTSQQSSHEIPISGLNGSEHKPSTTGMPPSQGKEFSGESKPEPTQAIKPEKETFRDEKSFAGAGKSDQANGSLSKEKSPDLMSEAKSSPKDHKTEERSVLTKDDPLRDRKLRTDDERSGNPNITIKKKETPEKVTVGKNDIVQVVYSGHHDSFNRAVVHAAFGSIAEETDLYKGTKPLYSQGFKDAMAATTVFAAKNGILRDAAILKKKLTDDQMSLLSKMLEHGHYGTFDLSNPENYKESLTMLHDFMKNNGIMEKRSLRGAGAESLGLDADKEAYRGSFTERRMQEYRETIVNRNQKEAGLAGKADKKGALSKEKPIGKDKEGLIGQAKKAEKHLTNKEKALRNIRLEAKKLGASEKDAERIVDVLFKNNGKFASTSRLIKTSGIGLKNVLTVNPFKNTLANKHLKEDEYARYVYRTKSVVSGAQAIYHAGLEISEAINIRREAVLAKKLNKLDQDLLGGKEMDPLRKTKLERKKEDLTRKRAKATNKNEKIKVKKENRLKKNREFTKKKEAIVNKLKAPMRKIKEPVVNVANKVPGLRRIINFKWANHTRLLSVISKPGELYSKIVEFFLKKLIVPIISTLGPIILHIVMLLGALTLLLCCTMIIQSFFTTEDGDVDDATSQNSTMMGVYNELVLEETGWAKGLLDLASDITVHIKELRYSDIDENTGNAYEGKEDMDAATYISEKLGLEYDAATDTIKTPSPWAGAPEEAMRTADGTITGGVEVRYIGTGGYPGYTSNIMELISMASVAQNYSTLNEFEDDDLSDANSDTVLGHISNFFGTVWKSIRTAANAVGAIVDKIMHVVPGYSEFMKNQDAKSRMRTLMAYTKPLFDVSHQMAFGLQFSFLPTDRSLSLEGAESINQFIYNSWYGEGGGNYASLSEVSDSKVAREVWTYLLAHGFDEIHAAGVMGNFYQESRMNPNAVQYPGLRKGGVGLGQWTGLTTGNDRRLRLENYAARLTGSTEGWKDNVKLQLDFMMLVDEPATIQRYLRTSFADPGAAAYWWGHNWERFNESDGTMNSTRIPAANAYYKIYAEDQSFDFAETDDIAQGNTGDSLSSVTQTNYKEKTEIVHSPNVDEDGDANGTYKKNERDIQVVTIDGASSLTVEMWYSTEKSYDWIMVTNKDQGKVVDWSNPPAATKYTGGRSKEKPDDDSAYHVTFTIEGDTAYFNFYSDRSNQYYGYYAKVTGKSIDNSWLDDQIDASTNYTTLINNIYTCPGHNGHGCQSFAGVDRDGDGELDPGSGFSYNDTTRQYVYYDGERIDNVYPAGLDPDESGEIPCNAPSGLAEDFFEALDANPDCWEYELVSSRSGLSGEGYDDGGSSFLSDMTDYGYKATRISSSQFSVSMTTDVYWEEGDDEDDDGDWYHDQDKYVFTHKCKGTHTGYYCGGHVRLLVYGIVYHMTTDERDNNHDAYDDKTLSMDYLKNFPAEYYENASYFYKEDLLKQAKDLFDLDHAIVHVNRTVDNDFEGWNYDNIDMATLPLLSDWNELYGISATWTINGINASSATGSTDTTVLSSADQNKILAAIEDQLPHDTTDKVRVEALRTGLFYVGKISYSQLNHGNPLREGGKNDCSGFVSRVYYDVIQKILNTDGFVDWAKKYGAYRNFSDGKCKPGDILLSGMGNATRSDNHALLYVGRVDGTHKSIDCSNRGGNGSIYYSDRGSSYYQNCTYIDMTTAIKGYLLLHPEMAENIMPSETVEEETEGTQN